MNQGPPHLSPGAHAESYTSSGKLKTRMKLSFLTALTDLMSVTPACLVLLTFLDHPAYTGEYIFIESCRTAEFYIFG